MELFWRLTLQARLEAGMPLTRTAYQFEGDSTALFAQRLFLARGELGLQARVW